jgi:hypothetical protein
MHANRLMWDNGTTLTPSSVIVLADSVELNLELPTNGQVLYVLTYVRVHLVLNVTEQAFDD